MEVVNRNGVDALDQYASMRELPVFTVAFREPVSTNTVFGNASYDVTKALEIA